MEILLRGYQVTDATWFYLSCLLILAVFARFGRLVSIRNLDLVLLLSIAPGLLLVRQRNPQPGYVWLFVVSALLLVRALADNLMPRRPHIRPNLNAAGLTFLCASAFVFLMARVMAEPPHPGTVETVERAERMLDGRETRIAAKFPEPTEAPAGPASPLLSAPLVQFSRVTSNHTWNVGLVAARSIVVMAHLAVIAALIFVGWKLFNDFETGIATATLYMLLPCTAYDVGRAMHVLPAAFIVWAIGTYRRPVITGMLMGLACGTLFFPILLLPLWCVFYGWRGAVRFMAAVALVAGSLVSVQFLIAPDSSFREVLSYLELEQLMFRMSDGQFSGFWNAHDVAWRMPVFVTYLVMVSALVLWPRKKHLGHLIAHSAATILGIQFWYLQAGGVYVLWYLPLVILMVYRPTLTQHAAPEMAPLLSRQKIRQADPKAPTLAT